MQTFHSTAIQSAEHHGQQLQATRLEDKPSRKTFDRPPTYLQETRAVHNSMTYHHTGRRTRVLSSLLFAIFALTPVARSQIQPIVATTSVNLTPSGGITAGPAVADACGNVYVNESGQIVEFAAGTGAQTIVAADQQGYGGPSSIAIDPTMSYIYFPLGTSANNQWYSSQWSVTPITHCVPGSPTNFPATGVSSLYAYYFGTAAVMGTDGYGDLFFSPTQGPNPNSIAEIGCSQGGQVACTSYPSGANAALLTGTLSKQPTSIAGDLNGNLFYTDGSANLYEIVQPNVAAAAKATYTPTIAASSFVSAVAVSFDSAGNLFITDSNGYNGNIYYNTNLTAIVYEVPNESGTLNFADMYIVANNLGVAAQPAVDAADNLYYTSYPPSSEQNLTRTLRGTMSVPAANVGTSTTAPINYVFNANETPASIGLTGSYGATITSGGGTCAAGTSYTAGQSCTVIAKYTPTAPGAQPGVAQLLNSAGSPLLSTAISGSGIGAAITVDPGAQTSISTRFKQPLGVSVDPNNNLYIADSSANTVTTYVSGTAALLSTGSLTLTAPSSAVADAQFNVYISDTGNNRIVEIPGSPSGPVTANAVALAISAGGTALKGPTGLAIGPFGDLFIADTGNNRVVLVPNRSGSLAISAAVAYGTGLSGPTGLAVDLNGNVFVADTGNGAILKLSAPLASGTQLNVVTGLNSPSAVAVDASGSLFVVNEGAASVEKFPLLSGLFGSPTFVGGTIAAPYGVALDGGSNLLVTDSAHGALYSINRSVAALPFGNANLNTTSAPQTATVSNGGNSSLVFSTPDYTASGATTQFAVSSDGCTGSTIVPGNACGITATFTPTQNESNATETLAFSSNAYTAASLALVGTGKTLATTTTTIALTAPTSGTLAAGVSATFTATITGVGSPAPTGYVTFYVNGSQDGPNVPLTGTTASLTFPNGLPAGAVTVLATYSGDSNFSGSQASVNETVVGLNAALSLTITTPYYNPQSTNDSPANATGPSVPLTATLAVSSKIIPTGTVKFYSGTSASSTLIGIGTLTPVSGGYQATASENSLRALTGTAGEDGSIIDNYTIFAVYSGDNFYVPETSGTVPLIVVGAPATQAACATGSSATCYPNTTGATFTITPTNPSLTIISSGVNGQTNGSVNLTVTSMGGWQGVLNFTCSNLPVYATCAPYPGSPLINPITTLGSSTPTNVQFFINTNVAPTPPNASGFIWWVSGLFGISLLMMRRRLARRGLHGLGLTLGMLLLLAGSIGTTTGCGSGSNSSSVKTPSGTTNVKVVVTAAQQVPCTGCSTITLNAKDADPITFNIALTVQ